MKTIFVDAVYTFVSDQGVINQELYNLLEKFENPKIILTNAPYEKFTQYGLDNVPYSVFTMSKNPIKLDSNYFKKLLSDKNLNPDNCIYFEHNIDAVKSAQSLGIISYHLDKNKQDLKKLEMFLKKNI